MKSAALPKPEQGKTVNVISWFKQDVIRWLGSCLLIVGYMATADAAVQNITAVFRPDPANPLNNKFVNTTPESGLCAWHPPMFPMCKALGIFTIRTEDILFTSRRPIPANHENERDGFMFRVPSSWRDMQVVHTETGAVEKVQMRIAGIGNRFDVLGNPPGTDAWGPRWSTWPYAPAPCVSTNYSAGNSSYMLWFWVVPEGTETCSRKALMDVPAMKTVTFEYAYEIRNPNPLTMSTGQYIGSMFYTIGPGMDFDFGDVMIPNDNTLTFNVTLDVQHALKIEIPHGGNRVVLEPQGGWQSWLNNNSQPARLFRDQTFNISASSRFKMKLECGQEMGDTCGLRNAANHQVPMQISVSLPNGLTRADGSPVNRQPLLLSGAGTELFQPGFYVDRKPGTLHFEVGREDTKEMLKHGGSQYSGTATVVWDSEV